MKFFILCGAGAQSGGPELAHQLCHRLNQLEACEAKMCYVDLVAPVQTCLPVDVSSPERYVEYGTDHARTLEEMDKNTNIIIIPEGLTPALACFTKAKIVIWWMSVDNYFSSTQGANLEEIRARTMIHLVQSHYADDFCKANFGLDKIMFLSDYINPAHGTFVFPAEYRQDIVLYNPAKGFETLKKLKERVTWLEWIALSGLDLEQTIFMMQNAKLYVDFGNHPGKDRIPREAAANGCCVITNRKGSAAFHEDVPIPEEYKFSNPEDQMDEIEQMMRDIIGDFPKHQKRFQSYREWIAREKLIFESDAELFVERLRIMGE